MKVLNPYRAYCEDCDMTVESYYECEPTQCECGSTQLSGSKLEYTDGQTGESYKDTLKRSKPEDLVDYKRIIDVETNTVIAFSRRIDI